MADGPVSSPAASPARVEANRANAALSTGPRTAEGRTRSSSNALAHGLTARSVVIRGERFEEWESFRDATLADLDARGPVETALATRVAEILWRLRRAGAAEAAIADFALARAERESLAAALDATTGPGDGSPFCFRSADTIDELRGMALRAKAAGDVAQLAMDASDDTPLDARAARDVMRLVALAAGLGDPEHTSSLAADELARRAVRGENAATPPVWTAGSLRMVAAAFAAAARVDDDEEDIDACERTPLTEGSVLIGRARRTSLEAAVRGLLAEKDARQRLALTRGTAATSDEAAPVRRHEAHLQRQLAGALALFDGARARRQTPQRVQAPGGDYRTGVRVVSLDAVAEPVAAIEAGAATCRAGGQSG